MTSYENVLLASRQQSGLVMSVRLCWHCITRLRQNHSNGAIRHLRNEKGTGAEMRPAIPVRNLQRCTAPQNRCKIAVQLNYSCSAAF